MKKLLWIILLVSTLSLGCNTRHAEIESLVTQMMDQPDSLPSILKQHPRSRNFHEWLAHDDDLCEEMEYMQSFNRNYSITTYVVDNEFLGPGRRSTVVQAMRADSARQMEFYFSMHDEGGELIGWKSMIHFIPFPPFQIH